MSERIDDLINSMTLPERADQLREQTTGAPRIGLPGYDYWNECLHGVARSPVPPYFTTVFPQAIGLAAMWDTNTVNTIADVIATEARAINRDYTESHGGNSIQYTGLNFWTPNINIFRDPRWGRGQETYGEDPFLTARLAVAFITGLQGNDPNYYKALACAKHFAVHSGPEAGRYGFDATPAERDLYETYLPQFEAAVREAHVGAVMAAYNSISNVPCVCNPFLLTDLLRKQWGFDGHVVSDCGAINHVFEPGAHHFTPDMATAEALSLKAGCDLGCWGDPTTNGILGALSRKLITEAEIRTNLTRVLAARFKLGMFDPPSRVKYAQIPTTQRDTPANARLALDAARKSMVLLKNDGILPLDRTKLKKILVLGSNAFAQSDPHDWRTLPMQLGEYNGIPSHLVSILDGIANMAGTNVSVTYAPGCSMAYSTGITNSAPSELAYHSNMVALAQSNDIVIYVGGLSPRLENEESVVPFEGFNGGDRTVIELPNPQHELLRDLQATGKPVIFVNCSGSAVAFPWEAEHLPAILQAWYPGQEGGTAVAEVLFGEFNPAGRLPVTFYRSTADLPSFTSYSMANRTYRYFTGKPLYAFGHGLSYTKFDYASAKADKSEAAATESVKVSVDVKNSGGRGGDEVVQVYFRHINSAAAQPNQALCGFQRVAIPPGETKTIDISFPIQQFRYWDVSKHAYVVEAGKYELLVGAASDDIRQKIPLIVK